MKAGWQIKPLGDVCNFQRGLTYAKTDEVDISNNIVLRATNIDLKTNLLDFNELKYINDNFIVTDSKKVKKGSLIICTASGSKSHLGKVAYVDDDYGYAFGGFMGMVTPQNELLPKYLFHLMTSESYKDYIGALSDGANINNLKFDDLKKFQIPYPSIQEQQRIVAILDQAFEGMAKARANAEQNLQNARALFESHLQSVFTQRGEGWFESKLGEVVELDKTQHKPNNALPYVGMEDIESDTGNFIGSKEPRKVKSSTFHFNDSHVLYGRLRPYLNKVLLPDFEGHCSTEVFPLLPNSSLDRRFLFYWLTLNSTKEKINATCTGARMPRANMNDVLTFDFSYPSLNIQKIIVENLKELSKETQCLEALYQRKITLLDELKKSLLQQAFAGEL